MPASYGDWKPLICPTADRNALLHFTHLTLDLLFFLAAMLKSREPKSDFSLSWLFRLGPFLLAHQLIKIASAHLIPSLQKAIFGRGGGLFVINGH